MKGYIVSNNLSNVGITNNNERFSWPIQFYTIFTFIIINFFMDVYKSLFVMVNLANNRYLDAIEGIFILLFSGFFLVLWTVLFVFLIHRKKIFKSIFLFTVIINLCFSICIPAFHIYEGFPFLKAYWAGVIGSLIAEGVGYNIFLIPFSLLCLFYVFSGRGQHVLIK